MQSARSPKLNSFELGICHIFQFTLSSVNIQTMQYQDASPAAYNQCRQETNLDCISQYKLQYKCLWSTI